VESAPTVIPGVQLRALTPQTHHVVLFQEGHDAVLEVPTYHAYVRRDLDELGGRSQEYAVYR
jgi:hypothetical protein